MDSYWIPANISDICHEQNTPLTQCSQLSFLYLSLVAQLYGSSIDLRPNPYGDEYRNEYPSNNFGSLQMPSSISHPKEDNDAGYLHSECEDKVRKDDYTNYWKRTGAEEYDFIVVGGGSGGCVVASRLSEVKRWKILLLEAGPEEPDVTSVPGFAPTVLGSNIDWNYYTQPEELTCRALRGQTCAWFRGKTMGGCSAVNLLFYIRGNKKDYDHWAELGNYGWSYNEVLPYFKKCENNRNVESRDTKHHGVGGPMNVERFPYRDINSEIIVQAFEEKGLPKVDLTGERQLGTNLAQTTSKNGRRMSANVAYIRPVRHKRPNLIIRTEALVTKILIHPETKIAYGVTYIKDGKVHRVYAKKEVIISAGSINSAKLLMLSGIGPKSHLEALEIPVLSDLSVGKNLQDHVTTTALILQMSKTSTKISGIQLLNEVLAYYGQKDVKTGPLGATGGSSAVAFIKSQYATEDAPDLQYHFDARDARDFFLNPSTYTATNILPLSFSNGLLTRPILLTPKSRGYILLNQTDPIFGPPLIYPGFFTEKEDLDVLLAGTKFAVSLEETQAFKSNGLSFVKTPVEGCSEYQWGSDDYYTCLFTRYTTTIYHPSGTCKMGPANDKNAVVDPELRVYGIQRLRVADASIIPLIIRGNTNAPVMMIGEKVSDMIKEEWLTCF